MRAWLCKLGTRKHVPRRARGACILRAMLQVRSRDTRSRLGFVCMCPSRSLSRSGCVCVRLRVRMCECECRCGRQRGGTCARLCRVACVSHSICGRVLGAGDRRKADVPVYSDRKGLFAKDTRPPACLLACGAIVGTVGMLCGIRTRTRAAQKDVAR